MKDRFEAKFYLLIIPILIVWELVYQLVIVKIFPAAADSDLVHAGGFILFAAAFWVIGKRRMEKEEGDGEEGGML